MRVGIAGPQELSVRFALLPKQDLKGSLFMSRPRKGRPHKGPRAQFHIPVPARDTLLLYGLCRKHGRDRGAIISAAVIVGLQHLDELPHAVVTWHHHPVPLPADLPLGESDSLPGWVKTSMSDGPQRLRLMLPAVYTQMTETVASTFAPTQSQRPAIRSALLWIGLHHIDEIPAILAELDDVQRGLAAGQTVLSFYSGELVNTGRTPEDFARARELLRRHIPSDEVAAATGIPVELLAALRGEITGTSTAEGGDQLALMSAV